MARRVRQKVGDIEETFPRRFGNYLLVESLAQGGMGEVYLAKYGFEDEEGVCVVKKLLPELTRDREYVTRFVDEARVVVTLEHENISEVFDVGRAGKEYYLAMEYISGVDVKSIAERCAERGEPLAVPAALQIVIETLGACDYAHKRKHPLTKERMELVHRDISPHNVVIDYSGTVKLIDFGLASSSMKLEKTEPNVVMGKMAYMGPEQARGDEVDPRSDLFALAVVLYELLAGERYYAGLTPNDIWNTVGKGGFVPRRFSDIDEDLQEIISRGLHPKPRKRPKDCKTFRKMLVEYLHAHFAESGEDALKREIDSLFPDEMRIERARLEAVNAIRFHDFGPAETPEIGRDQKHPMLTANDKSVLTTREKELVVEATEIVARRAPRFHGSPRDPSQRIMSSPGVAWNKNKRVVTIAASVAAVLLVIVIGVLMLGGGDDETTKDVKSPARKETKVSSSEKKKSTSTSSKKTTKKSSSKKRRSPHNSRLVKLKAKKCKNSCVGRVVRTNRSYSKLSSSKRKRLYRDIVSCEKKCR